MMWVSLASEILLCKATCSNSCEVMHMWSEGEPALSMFIWHAPGSVMMIEDGHRSDME